MAGEVLIHQVNWHELPEGVDHRLGWLLDKLDRGEELSDDERAEAEGLVELADLLSLIKLRAE